MIAGPELICLAGLHDVIFDIGIVFKDSFVATRPKVFQMHVVVELGIFKSLTLLPLSDEPLRVQTYQLIRSLEIMFLDQGLNEVSGHATFFLKCINTTASIHPQDAFSVSSNIKLSIKAMVDPFFIHNLDSPSAYLPTISIGTVNSSVPNVHSSVVHVVLGFTCSPGHRIRTPMPSELLKLLRLQLGDLSVAEIRCEVCVSIYYDATKCVSLRWSQLPTLVQSGQDIDVDGIHIVDETLEIVNNVHAIMMTVALIQNNNFSSQSNCSSVILHGFSTKCKIVRVVFDQSPGDHKWLIQLQSTYEPKDVLAKVLLPENGKVTALDWGPSIQNVVPDRLSFAGHSSITLSGIFPNSIGGFFSGNANVSLLRNHSCVFSSLQRSGNVNIVVPCRPGNMERAASTTRCCTDDEPCSHDGT
jgi:hypothetical protein